MPQKKSTSKSTSKATTTESGKSLDDVITKAKRIVKDEMPIRPKSKTPSKSKKEASEEEEEEEEEEEPTTQEVVVGNTLKFKFTPPEWKPRFDAGDPIRVCLISMSNGGKSYALKYLLNDYLVSNPRWADYFVIVCGSTDEIETYSKIVESWGKPVFASERWPEQMWGNICSEYEQSRLNGEEPLRPCIIVDDQGSRDLVDNDDFISIYTNGRHKGASIITLVQAARMVGQIAKAQSSLIFIGKTNNVYQREVITRQILSGMVPVPVETTAAQEHRFIKQLLVDYAKNQGDMIVLDYRPKDKRGNKEDSDVFWWRAPPTDDWLAPPKDDDAEEEEEEEVPKRPKSFKK